MKLTAFAIALLAGGAALAQPGAPAAYDGDGLVTAAYETEGSTALPTTSDMPAASGALVQPGNADPERDARGIAVISDPATVPAGWNGTAAGAAMGGPELDAVTGETIAPDAYPACTAAVTDNCLQDYEVRRH
jgi:hypothetical protein